MKTILLYLLLATLPVLSQTTNEPPAKVLVVLLVDQENLPKLLSAITNFNAKVIDSNSKYGQLTAEIRLMEQRYNETYSGIPQNYVGDGSEQSQKTLNSLIETWKQQNLDKQAIEAKKDELKALKE